MSKTKIEKPFKININDIKSTGGPYGGTVGVNSVILRHFFSIEGLAGMGAAILEPGMRTVPFSALPEDDGKAEHFYGPFNEYYHAICGEFAMYYGKDADKVRDKTSEKIILKPGDFGHWTPGWVYMCVNIGSEPGMFLYSMTRAPGFKPFKRRGFEETVIHHLYPHLKRHLKEGDS